MSVVARDETPEAWNRRRIAEIEAEVERLRVEWRKADDGWIACRQQLEGAVRALERIAVMETSGYGSMLGIARSALAARGQSMAGEPCLCRCFACPRCDAPFPRTNQPKGKGLTFDTKGVDVHDSGRVFVSEADGLVALSACWADGVTSVEMTPEQAEEVIAELTLAARSGLVSLERKRIGVSEVPRWLPSPKPI